MTDLFRVPKDIRLKLSMHDVTVIQREPQYGGDVYCRIQPTNYSKLPEPVTIEEKDLRKILETMEIIKTI